jgi:hypothetical protein
MGSLSKLAVLGNSLALTFGALPAWSNGVWSGECADVSTTWKVTRLVHGYFERNDGGRGFFRAEGNTLAYYDQGMPYPAWRVTLEPDGSYDRAIGRSNKRLRIKIAPGTGPREITTISERTLFGFRYVAD